MCIFLNKLLKIIFLVVVFLIFHFHLLINIKNETEALSKIYLFIDSILDESYFLNNLQCCAACDKYNQIHSFIVKHSDMARVITKIILLNLFYFK